MDSKAEAKAPDDEMDKKYMEKFDQLRLTDSEDEFPDIECPTCCKSFPTVQIFEQHLNGRKHYKVLSKLKSRQKLGDDAPKKRAREDPLDTGEELYCDVCDKEMCGYTNYMAHVKGSVHAKNLRQLKLREKVKGMKESLGDGLIDADEEVDDILQKPFARCSTCCKTFYGPESYQQHMKGANHEKKLRHLKVVESLKNDDAAENGMEEDESYRCKVCNKAFSGPVPYKIHLKSAVHEKALQRVAAEKELKDYFEKETDGEKLVCKECKKAFPDAISLKSHLANNSHDKQKVKDVMFGFVACNADIMAVKSVQNLDFSDDDTEENESFQAGHNFLVCKLCNVSFSGPESALDHIRSRKHINLKTEKAEKKILMQKLKEKQNRGPVTDQKASEIAVIENASQDTASTNGEKKGLVTKQTDTPKIQEEFEFL